MRNESLKVITNANFTSPVLKPIQQLRQIWESKFEVLDLESPEDDAGCDGIENKIHPGNAMDQDLYKLPKEEADAIPTVCSSLRQALTALKENHDFLLKGDVFSEELIASFIELKTEELERYETTTHPVEVDMYYSS